MTARVTVTKDLEPYWGIEDLMQNTPRIDWRQAIEDLVMGDVSDFIEGATWNVQIVGIEEEEDQG